MQTFLPQAKKCSLIKFCSAKFIYDEIDGIEDVPKERYIRMMAEIDKIHAEFGLPPPTDEELARRERYEPETFYMELRKERERERERERENNQY